MPRFWPFTFVQLLSAESFKCREKLVGNQGEEADQISTNREKRVLVGDVCESSRRLSSPHC